MTKADAKKVKIGDVLITKQNEDGVSCTFKVEEIETGRDASYMHEYIWFKGNASKPRSGSVKFNHKEIRTCIGSGR